MYYVIHFYNSNNETTRMAFLLHDSNAAKIFIRLTEEDIANRRAIDHEHSYNFAMDYGHIAASEASTRLNAHIDAFNAIQKREFKFSMERFKFSGDPLLDRELLNRQHADFEFFMCHLYKAPKADGGHSEIREERIRSAGLTTAALPQWNSADNKQECTYHLNNINSLIHTLEWKVYSYYSRDDSLLNASISYTVKNGSKIMNTQEYHRYFNLGVGFGSLVMNYSTTGKNLSSLYLDNDVAYLEQGGRTTPQESINSGILAMFSGKATNRIRDNNFRSHELRKASFDKWFQANDIGRFGYDMDCESNCLGFIPLGMYSPTDPLGMDSTLRDVVDHYRQYPMASHFELRETLDS